MYIWIGCKLPEEFEKEVRERCLALNEQIGLDTAAFLLPQHISLKISFQTDAPDAILEDLKQFAAQQSAFTVRLLGTEQAGNILWLPVEENVCLRQLHEALDERLESRFGIPQHEFDKCFRFHSTLFIDPDTEKVARMGAALGDYQKDRELTVDTFVLGVSETGKPGTYHVVSEVQI